MLTLLNIQYKPNGNAFKIHEHAAMFPALVSAPPEICAIVSNADHTVDPLTSLSWELEQKFIGMFIVHVDEPTVLWTNGGGGEIEAWIWRSREVRHQEKGENDE